MKKYLIRWNVGYGDEYDVVEEESLRDAEAAASERYDEEAASNADWGAQLLTRELAEEHGIKF